MKDKILKITKCLEEDTINDNEAKQALLNLFSNGLDSIPIFQYNVAIEGQRQMIEHIEYLSREIERKNIEILEKDKLIEIYKDELLSKSYR